MAKLKVYGANSNRLGVQARSVAAVSNQKQFANLIGASIGYVRDYAAETGNANSVEEQVAYTGVGDLFIHCPTCKHWHNWSEDKRRAEGKK